MILDWKKGLGIGLIFIGIFIIATARTLTGAVVGVEKQNLLGLVGVVILSTGIILLSLEKHVGYETEDIIKIMKHAGRDAVFVLDSSGAIDYGREVHYLVDICKDRVYVPNEVLKELEKDSRGRILIERELKDKEGNLKVKQFNPDEDREGYRSLARLAIGALKETDKHKDYKIMRKIIEEDKVPVGISNYEFEEYMDKIDYELSSRFRNKYHREPTKEDKLMLLRKEYRAGKGDADVLVTALKNVALGKKVEILAHDTHLRDAVDSLVEKYPGLRGKLEYVGYREYAEAAA